MCLATQPPARFQHVDPQRWSDDVVLLTCWLRHVLCATTARTFSTSQLPKVAWDRQLFTLLTSKYASRYNSVHFFGISTSKSALKLKCFAHFDLETRFAPQWPATFDLSFGRLFRDFPTFSRTSQHLLSSDFLLFDLLSSHFLFFDFVFPSSLFFDFHFWLSSMTSPTSPIAAFHLSIWPEVWFLTSFHDKLVCLCMWAGIDMTVMQVDAEQSVQVCYFFFSCLVLSRLSLHGWSTPLGYKTICFLGIPCGCRDFARPQSDPRCKPASEATDVGKSIISRCLKWCDYDSV